MKRFRVAIEVNGFTMFDGTNKQEQVDEWLKCFANSKANSIKVYELVPDVGGYALRHSLEHSTERSVGFERW